MTKVDFVEFAEAASRLHKMKRTPRGARGSVIPSDTLLSSHSDGVMVETNAVSSLVVADTPWEVELSIDARKLIQACEGLKRIGAAGHQIDISVEGRMLCLRHGPTKLSIPTIWVGRP